MILNESISKISLDQLKQAVQLKEQIAVLESQLSAILGGAAAPVSVSVAAPGAPPVRRGRGGPRLMSPEARLRIAAAQKARWARFHAERGTPARASLKPKRTNGISAEGRARIIAAQKARWARFHAQNQGR